MKTGLREKRLKKEYSAERRIDSAQGGGLLRPAIWYSERGVSYISANWVHVYGKNGITLPSDNMKKLLIISTSIDLVRIAPERIVYISSDGNYSTIVQTDGEARLVSFQLGQMEKLIQDQLGEEGKLFIRIGRNLIINRSYIHYINVSKQKLILSDVVTFSHNLTAAKDALKELKELIEKEAK